MTDDLNQRVQARLTECERAIAGHVDDRGIEVIFACWAQPAAFRPIVASWRERWERHNRLRPYNAGVLGKRYVCVYDGHHDPCPDKQAVLREIGVEP